MTTWVSASSIRAAEQSGDPGGLSREGSHAAPAERARRRFGAERMPCWNITRCGRLSEL